MKALVALIIVLSLLLVPTSKAGRRSQAEEAITYVFGPYAAQALRVAWCESRYSVWAQNGQYLGLFQMGSSARARYGHAWNAWAQAVSAYRYFIDSGRDWSPWTCKP